LSYNKREISVTVNEILWTYGSGFRGGRLHLFKNQYGQEPKNAEITEVSLDDHDEISFALNTIKRIVRHKRHGRRESCAHPH